MTGVRDGANVAISSPCTEFRSLFSRRHRYRDRREFFKKIEMRLVVLENQQSLVVGHIVGPEMDRIRRAGGQILFEDRNHPLTGILGSFGIDLLQPIEQLEPAIFGLPVQRPSQSKNSDTLLNGTALCKDVKCLLQLSHFLHAARSIGGG